MTTFFIVVSAATLSRLLPRSAKIFCSVTNVRLMKAKEAIAGMKARIAELERIQAMNPIRRWFYQKFHI